MRSGLFAALLSLVTITCAQDSVSNVSDLKLVALSAGNGFTCGLTSDSTAWCWGANEYGQLGVEPTDETCKVDPVATGPCRARPVAVSGKVKFTSIDAGESHVCALTPDGRAFCWGDNASGQLGNADSSQTCSVAYYAERGFGPYPCARAPKEVAGDQRYTAISAASGYTCGLTVDGAVRCWGHWTNQRFGGSGEAISEVAVSHLQKFTSISADGGSVCALTSVGSVLCWSETVMLPTLIETPVKFASVSRGWRHTCGLTSDGAAYCWGDNDSGQLGDGSVNPQLNSADSTVRLVESDRPFKAISAGFVSTCAVAVDGAQYCWGDEGVLGAQASEGCKHAEVFSPCALRPVKTSLSDVVAMASGFSHRCALTSDGTTYCWGKRVADGARVSRPEAVRF